MTRTHLSFRGLSRCGLGALLFLSPLPARAHLVTTGMGPVYDGIGHLLLTPEDLVPVVAAALYAGLRGTAAGRRAMFLIPLAWLLGGLAGSAWATVPTFPVPALSFLALGALVAADLALPAGATTCLWVLFGLVHGVLNGAALRSGPGALGLLGIAVMLFVFVTLVAASVASLQRPWTRIAVRVAGSWVAASGLLMLGWALR